LRENRNKSHIKTKNEKRETVDESKVITKSVRLALSKAKGWLGFNFSPPGERSSKTRRGNAGKSRSHADYVSTRVTNVILCVPTFARLGFCPKLINRPNYCLGFYRPNFRLGFYRFNFRLGFYQQRCEGLTFRRTNQWNTMECEELNANNKLWFTNHGSRMFYWLGFSEGLTNSRQSKRLTRKRKINKNNYIYELKTSVVGKKREKGFHTKENG
jgi:hypothetical protein